MMIRGSARLPKEHAQIWENYTWGEDWPFAGQESAVSPGPIICQNSNLQVQISENPDWNSYLITTASKRA